MPQSNHPSNVSSPAYPKPPIVTRAEWNAAPGDATKMGTHTIEWVTLHHGGVIFDGSKDPKTSIKNLQSWGSREKGWGDVPYHFEIDLNGVVYECREIQYAGDTNTAYNPKGHALVCLMGNYEEQVVNQKQLDAIVEMCAWLCSEYKVPPTRIKGHKDYAETLCPGKNFYPHIADGTIARLTTERLLAKGCVVPKE